MEIIVLLATAVAVVADQLLKGLVLQYVKPVGHMTVIPGFLDFLYVENRGAAFSILQNQQWFFITVASVASLIILIALFRYRRHEFFSYAASALIVGGGIGNLLDRIRYGYVVDYLSVSFFPPIFNFADCCVTVGTICLIIHLLWFSERDKNVERVLHSK